VRIVWSVVVRVCVECSCADCVECSSLDLSGV